jgi:hypothetical protein
VDILFQLIHNKDKKPYKNNNLKIHKAYYQKKALVNGLLVNCVVLMSKIYLGVKLDVNGVCFKE